MTPAPPPCQHNIADRMPRKLIKRIIPDHKKIREHKHLRFFGTLLHDPNLWHLNRRSVRGAITIGLFMAFMPFPSQMLLAAAAAIMARVNLPISVALVWISNPLTIPPMFYSAYKVGTWILNIPRRELEFELSVQWMMAEVGAIWAPLLTGCLVLGTLSAAAGNIAIRLLWRMHVWQYIKKRRERRKLRRLNQQQQ